MTPVDHETPFTGEEGEFTPLLKKPEMDEVLKPLSEGRTLEESKLNDDPDGRLKKPEMDDVFCCEETEGRRKPPKPDPEDAGRFSRLPADDAKGLFMDDADPVEKPSKPFEENDGSPRE